MGDYSFGKFLEEEFSITPLRIIKWMIALSVFMLAMDTAFSLYYNGIPKTHNGNIIYVSHNYNKFYNYDWTDVEVLTYSGDSHHIYFWGHQEFELRTNYHIHTRIRNRFFALPWPTWVSRQEIVEMEIIDS